MKILIAEDEPVAREKLSHLLQSWGYEVVVTTDGSAAWEVMCQADAPALVIADVQMPGISGDELCRRARAELRERGFYIILLTSVKVTREDLVDGLLSGADDYLIKRCENAELQARLKGGIRVLGLQKELRARVQDLEEAAAQIKQLKGLLPICSYCKKVRDDKNYWHQLERYFEMRTEATFTHGICPACFKEQIESWDAITPSSGKPLS